MALQVTKSMMAALEQASDGAFQQAAAVLSQNREDLREIMQEKTAGKIAEILGKLAANGQLSAEEAALTRMWIVGDAESYINAENDLNGWLEEYKRLAGVLRGFEGRDCSEQDAMKLSGILEDAIRTSYDIANFLEKKDRIAKFDRALSDGVDDDEREILVRVLNGKLRSAEY